MLKVTINKIVPRAYATNFNVPGMFGQFPQQFQDGQVRYMYLDLDKMQTEFIPGVVVPLRPFPPGKYELDVEVRDRLTRATVKATVAFTVASGLR